MSVASADRSRPTTYCHDVATARTESWESAWERTLTGPDSFYRHQPPQQHFTTTVLEHDGIARLVLAHVRSLLIDHPSNARDLRVTDLGSGHGMLLRQLQTLLASAGFAHRVELIGVDIRQRPEDLPDSIRWVNQDVREYLRSTPPERGVRIAHELLDDIPLPIVEFDEDGVMHRIDADPDGWPGIIGAEHRDSRDLEWLEEWWPDRRPLARAEIGRPRDECWRQMLATMHDGVCLAVDYGHVRPERRAGTWDGGSCVGYRQGRVVTPRADGTCNITAHVAFDSLAAVGRGLAQPVVTREEPLPREFGAPPDMRILQAWCGPARSRATMRPLVEFVECPELVTTADRWLHP